MPNVVQFIRDHVSLEVECVDRLYLNGYIPTLQTPGQLVWFLTRHRGHPIPSPKLLGDITQQFHGCVYQDAVTIPGLYGAIGALSIDERANVNVSSSIRSDRPAAQYCSRRKTVK